jgi:small nuclear ribonucleoprotein (snRNP)-like protein
MADKIDPLISPMFTKTGQVTPEYHALPSKAGKIIAYDMQVNMVLNSTLNEQQQGERLEKFFNVTPNPRGAPDVESYIVAMQNDSKVLDTNSNNLRYLSPSQRQMYNMNLSYIQKQKKI